MRVTEYQIIERQVASSLGWDVDFLDSTEFRRIRDAASQALEKIWRYGYWHDLTISERRRYREAYDAAASYAVGAIVYHIASDAYYVALRASSGQAPASQLTPGAAYTVNDAYWSPALRAYSGEDYDVASGNAVGDQVYYPVTGRSYQCHTIAPPAALPTDQTYWGELVEFVAYIGWTQSGFLPIGSVDKVSLVDPEKYPGAAEIPWDPARLGVEPREVPAPTQPWILFLRRPHRFVGDPYDAALSYTAVDEEDNTSEIPTVSTGGGGSGGGSDGSGVAYAGIAALRARVTHTLNQLAYLAYIATDGDGGEGWFRFKSVMDADDGVDCARPNDISGGNPGRWIRIS